jgi:hypothetical protein
MNVLAFFLVPEGAQIDMTDPDVAGTSGRPPFSSSLDSDWCSARGGLWPLALALSVAFIGFGLFLSTQPGDITSPGAQIVGAVVLLIPGTLFLWAVVMPSSRRWFLDRPGRLDDPPPTSR